MRKSPESYSFLGSPLAPRSDGLSMTAQVQAILVREIQNGRWEIGERLPGITALSKQSGLSPKVVQCALENLRHEGYLEQRKYFGTFLISSAPGGRRSRGTIGIAIPDELAEGSELNNMNRHRAWFNHLFIKWIQNAAAQRGYSIETLLVHPDEWADIDSVEGAFHERVLGIIALHTFQRALAEEIPAGRIPMIFWRDHFQADCSPAIVHDQPLGFYLLTKRAIAEGHRDILFFSRALEEQEKTTDPVADRFAGYARAMQEAGLSPNREALEDALAVAPNDYAGIRNWLERWRKATAIVAMSSAMAEELMVVMDLMGIRIPQDVSLLCPGPTYRQGKGEGDLLTSLQFDSAFGAKTCFELLEGLIATRKHTLTRLVLAPKIVEGCSLAAPRAAVADGSK